MLNRAINSSSAIKKTSSMDGIFPAIIRKKEKKTPHLINNFERIPNLFWVTYTRKTYGEGQSL